jgi:hypothetical protein
MRAIDIGVHAGSTAIGETRLTGKFALPRAVAHMPLVTRGIACSTVGSICIGVHAGIAAFGHVGWARHTTVIGRICRFSDAIATAATVQDKRGEQYQRPHVAHFVSFYILDITLIKLSLVPVFKNERRFSSMITFS